MNVSETKLVDIEERLSKLEARFVKLETRIENEASSELELNKTLP